MLEVPCLRSDPHPFHLVAGALAQTGYGERPGQAPRAMDLQKPLTTIIADGTNGCGNGKHALVAALLAKHFGGHESKGSSLSEPVSTITTQDHHALVTSHMLKLRGTCAHGQPIDVPAPTVTASGTHIGEVRALLVKYYGEGTGQAVNDPFATVTTRDRFGLVTVHGELYAISDIGMRMLCPRELFRAQGFPDSYRIEVLVDRKPSKRKKVCAKAKKARQRPKKHASSKVMLTKTGQIKSCGNSVCPPLAAAIVLANLQRRKAVAA